MTYLLRILPVLAFAPVLGQLISPQPPVQSRPMPQGSEPANALGWFRRADNITNIRMPGSAPFHMKVIFHAYPGIDFAPREKSTIQTGDGVYEETWVSPETWRREVTFGVYHAVEVRAGGVRKFQASSDYEPSRAMMLLRALLTPIPRFILEPEIEPDRIHWKLEHLAAGGQACVRISYKHEVSRYGPEVRAYEFLPNGILARSEDDYTALFTSWQDEVPFAGRLVPRHLSVQGAGLGREMLTAELTIEPVAPSAAAIDQIPGAAAEPGMTLRTLEESETSGTPAIRFEPPVLTSGVYPSGVKTSVIAVVDREGTPREAELSGIRIYGKQPTSQEMQVISATAQRMIQSVARDRFHPALVDGKPCQVCFSLNMSSGSVTQM